MIPVMTTNTRTRTKGCYLSDMESKKEAFLSDLVVPYFPFNEEESLFLHEMETTINNESNADNVFSNGMDESFGLVPENTSWLNQEETAAKRRQKNRNHLSCKLMEKLSDEKLEKMSIQTLNKKFSQLPDVLVRKFRKRRRVLKNRKYALKCRKKDSQKTDNVAEENSALELAIFKAKEELRKVASERDGYKLKYERLNESLIACNSHGQ